MGYAANTSAEAGQPQHEQEEAGGEYSKSAPTHQRKSCEPDHHRDALYLLPHLSCIVPSHFLHADGQQLFSIGASVFDESHKHNRGYGIIKGPGPPGEDGTPRWQVSFERGQRTSAISQHYLCLAHIHHTGRVAPEACGQRIVVMVGPHKGVEGVTVSKVGACSQTRAST